MYLVLLAPEEGEPLKISSSVFSKHVSGDVADPPLQVYPFSTIKQSLDQPSPAIVFESSHASEECLTASPQTCWHVPLLTVIPLGHLTVTIS